MRIGFALRWLSQMEEYLEPVFDISRTLTAIKNMPYHY